MDEVTITIIEQPIEVTIAVNEGTELVITKSQIEGVLTGDIITHNHDTQVAAAMATLGSFSTMDIWIGTLAAYEALGAWDDNTLYFTT